MIKAILYLIAFSGLFFNRILPSHGQSSSNEKTIKIPVIFHVIFSDRSHAWRTDGGNVNENVESSLILKELKDLHDDFLLLNQDTSWVINTYKNLIGNAKIDFYLADTILQPNGERGIVRIKTNLNKSKLYKRSKVINHEKYLNVYIGNIHGSYSPSQTPWTLLDQDGVYLAFDWVGLRYRLLTHEVGHWCGLLHLWGTGDAYGDSKSCTVGDSVDDTPEQKEATETDASCTNCPLPIGTATDKFCSSIQLQQFHGLFWLQKNVYTRPSD